jgi:hypothetical protein
VKHFLLAKNICSPLRPPGFGTLSPPAFQLPSPEKQPASGSPARPRGLPGGAEPARLRQPACWGATSQPKTGAPGFGRTLAILKLESADGISRSDFLLAKNIRSSLLPPGSGPLCPLAFQLPRPAKAAAFRGARHALGACPVGQSRQAAPIGGKPHRSPDRARGFVETFAILMTLGYSGWLSFLIALFRFVSYPPGSIGPIDAISIA